MVNICTRHFHQPYFGFHLMQVANRISMRSVIFQSSFKYLIFRACYRGFYQSIQVVPVGCRRAFVVRPAWIRSTFGNERKKGHVRGGFTRVLQFETHLCCVGSVSQYAEYALLLEATQGKQSWCVYFTSPSRGVRICTRANTGREQPQSPVMVAAY